MKKIICISIIGLFVTTSIFAQKNVIDEVFKKYSKIESATVVDINGFLLKIAAKHDEDFKNLNISDIKVLTIEDPEDNKGINFYNEILPGLDLNVYKELIRITDKDQKVVILLKEKGTNIEEFLVVVGGSENTLVRIKGNINRDQFEEYANLADVNIHVD